MKPASQARDGASMGQNPSFRFHEIVNRKSEFFTCIVGQITGTDLPSPRRQRDVSRSSRSVVRVAMDAAASGGVSRRTKTPQRTAKSCGPGAATLASIRPACVGLATVTIKAAHRGEHEVSRKAIARGKPGCLGCTCQIRVRSSTTHCTRCCGRSRRPAFPAPSVRGGSKRDARPGRKRVAGMRTHVSPPVIASEAKQSSFLSRDKKAGLLRRFAPRNDGSGCYRPWAGDPACQRRL